jgi:hypothetical protein
MTLVLPAEARWPVAPQRDRCPFVNPEGICLAAQGRSFLATGRWPFEARWAFRSQQK